MTKYEIHIYHYVAEGRSVRFETFIFALNADDALLGVRQLFRLDASAFLYFWEAE